MKYQAGAQGVKRFGEALPDDPERKRLVSELKSDEIERKVLTTTP